MMFFLNGIFIRRNQIPVLLLLMIAWLPGRGLGQAMVSLPSSDTRLNAFVTVQCPGKPLNEVIISLINNAKTLSVSDVKTGKDASWDRVIAYMKNRPAREALQDLATLFNYRWKEVKFPGAAVYLLNPALEERPFERKLWFSSLDQAAFPLANVAKYARTSSAEWEKVSKANGKKAPDDPYLRNGNLAELAVPLAHARFRLFDTLSSAQRRSLVEKGVLSLPWSEMNSVQQAIALDSLRKPVQYGSDEFPLSPEKARLQEAAERERLQRFGILFTVQRNLSAGTVSGLGIGYGGVRRHVGVARIDPSLQKNQPRFPVRGKPYPSEALTQAPPAPPADSADSLERIPFPSDSGISEGDSWTAVMRKLSLSTSMAVFSDDFEAARGLSKTLRKPIIPSLDNKLSLAQGLDALCESFGYLWWSENGALFFRSRTWFIERLYETPPPILASLSKQIGSNGNLTIAALNTLSSLTFQQLQGLTGIGLDAALLTPDNPSLLALHSIYMVGTETNDLFYAFSLLQLFATLSEEQKTVILSGDGLSIDSMNDTQRQTYSWIAFARFGRSFGDKESDLCLGAFPSKIIPARKVTPTTSFFLLPIVFKMRQSGDSVMLPISFLQGEKDSSKSAQGARP